MDIVATLSLILDAGLAYLRSLSIMTAGSLAYTLRSVKRIFQEVSDLSERGNMQDYLFAKLPIALIKCVRKAHRRQGLTGLFRELKSSSVVVYNVLLSYADFNHKALRRWCTHRHMLSRYSNHMRFFWIK